MHNNSAFDNSCSNICFMLILVRLKKKQPLGNETVPWPDIMETACSTRTFLKKLQKHSHSLFIIRPHLTLFASTSARHWLRCDLTQFLRKKVLLNRKLFFHCTIQLCHSVMSLLPRKHKRRSGGGGGNPEKSVKI